MFSGGPPSHIQRGMDPPGNENISGGDQPPVNIGGDPPPDGVGGEDSHSGGDSSSDGGDAPVVLGVRLAANFVLLALSFW